MSVFPRNNRLTRRIKQLARDNHALNVERVIFLGPHGEVLDVVLPEKVDGVQLRDKRADLLRTGDLAAIAHLGASSISTVMQFHMIEVYTVGVPHVHSLITWPQQHRWLAIPQEASDRWLERWREGGSET